MEHIFSNILKRRLLARIAPERTSRDLRLNMQIWKKRTNILIIRSLFNGVLWGPDKVKKLLFFKNSIIRSFLPLTCSSYYYAILYFTEKKHDWNIFIAIISLRFFLLFFSSPYQSLQVPLHKPLSVHSPNSSIHSVLSDLGGKLIF